MLNKRAFALLALVVAPLVAVEARAEGGPSVVLAWARATPGAASVGAAYGEVIGGPKADDTLIGISTAAAGRAEIHTHIEEEGVMKMRRLDALPVKAGETVMLAPGGHHIMLFDLKAPLKEGEALPLTFEFKASGKVDVVAKVLAVGAAGPDAAATAGDKGSHAGSAEGSNAGSHKGNNKGSDKGTDKSPEKSEDKSQSHH